MKFSLVVAGAVLLLASACAQKDASFAESSERVSMSGVVEAVNLENRTFQVRDGRTTVVFRASPEVRNLAQLEPGDRINLDYYESIAVGLADPNDSGEAMGGMVAGRAGPGEKPGGGAVSELSGVIEFVSYDAAADTAVVRLHDETTRTVSVLPEMRDFAAARQPGDRVVAVIDRAVAVFVEEAS
ncbi:hypothetical protein [Tropicimonas sp.]|uniref:hypothetical protein n=1 Tax=Tropicimonas sp. TaxID=2067044 RepID=UPI003A8A4D36